MIGNDNADRLAGKWDKSPIDHNIVVKYFSAVKLVKAIQSRLSVIITNLPHREKQIKAPVLKVQRESLLQASSSSKHAVEKHDTCYFVSSASSQPLAVGIMFFLS